MLPGNVDEDIQRAKFVEALLDCGPACLRGSDIQRGVRPVVNVRENRCQAVLIPPDPFFFTDLKWIVDLVAKRRLPAVYTARDFVAVGGLMAYGPDVNALYSRLAVYVDKVFKGANPADLPIEQPTKFTLAVNLKTAKALGLTVPPSILVRADEIIQ